MPLVDSSDLGPAAAGFRAQARQRVADRVPLAFAIFVTCMSLSLAFEWHFYPDRHEAIVAVASLFLGLTFLGSTLIRRRPALSIATMVAAVNVIGVAICVYHWWSGAVAELCLLVLTALLTTVVVILPWGWRAQALACIGGLASFTVAILWRPTLAGVERGLHNAGPAPSLVAYLVVLVAIAAIGAELVERYLRSDYRLHSALREREVHLERAREAAESANRSKSDFLASMSHEFRTPMNVIFGMTDMALDSDLTDHQREFLRRTRAAAHSLLVLVNDILDFTRIEAGHLTIAPRAFALSDWMSETIQPLGWLAEEKGLALSWSVAPGLPQRVVGDPDRLAQVVVNLTANAIKFTESGRVSVAVAPDARDPGRFRFTVADTGPGIPKAQQTTIFDAFVQGDSPRESSRGGSGLGLAICARIVDRMGGRIWVESEPGRGSRFHFTVGLPIDGEDHFVAPPRSVASPA